MAKLYFSILLGTVYKRENLACSFHHLLPFQTKGVQGSSSRPKNPSVQQPPPK